MPPLLAPNGPGMHVFGRRPNKNYRNVGNKKHDERCPLFASVQTVVMKSQTSEPSDDVPLLSYGRLYAGACGNIPRTLADSVGLLHTNYYFPCLCVCLELCPSNATKAQPISTPTVSVDAPYLHLHSPLLASKSVLSWWSLVVVCTLFPRDKFQLELELQTGTSSYHAIYMYEYTSYV